eukprot:m.83313 g.83313  ORF g.83313 m.83313 type:complete len:342 (-) comp9530_c0_seq2:631-1656(-)
MAKRSSLKSTSERRSARRSDHTDKVVREPHSATAGKQKKKKRHKDKKKKNADTSTRHKRRRPSGTRLPSKPCLKRRFFIDALEHHIPFYWHHKLPCPRGVACVPVVQKQRKMYERLRMTVYRRRAMKHAGVRRAIRKADDHPQTLNSLLAEARARSILSKPNINLFRRRSSDFFDDFDMTLDGEDNNNNSGPSVAVSEAENENTANTARLSTPTADRDDSHDRVCNKPTQSPLAPSTPCAPRAATPDDTTVVISSDSDSDADAAAEPRAVAKVGAVTLYSADIASLAPRRWLTGSVVNAFTHLLNDMAAPATRLYAFSTFFFSKVASCWGGRRAAVGGQSS